MRTILMMYCIKGTFAIDLVGISSKPTTSSGVPVPIQLTSLRTPFSPLQLSDNTVPRLISA